MPLGGRRVRLDNGHLITVLPSLGAQTGVSLLGDRVTVEIAFNQLKGLAPVAPALRLLHTDADMTPLADMIPAMTDADLTTLRANAARLVEHGASTQVMAASDIIPVIDTEMARRAGPCPSPQRPRSSAPRAKEEAAAGHRPPGQPFLPAEISPGPDPDPRSGPRRSRPRPTQPDQVVGHAARLAHLPGHAGVGHDGRGGSPGFQPRLTIPPGVKT